MLDSGLNLVTTVIGFGLSATFIVFICARLICGRIRTSDSRSTQFDIELRSDLDPPEHATHGLEPVAVAAIPMMKYHHKAFHSKEDAQCSICLGEYEDKEVLRILPACLHNFHLTCIDLWLQKNSTCPICRLSLNATHEPRLAFSFTNDHSFACALPTQQHIEHIESSGSNQEISGAVSVVIGIPHGEHESGT